MDTVPRIASALLQLVEGNAPIRSLVLDQDTLLIGRNLDCHFILSDSSISQRHALIVRKRDGYYLDDLKSRNGTRVEGQRVLEPVRLRDGDTIQICDYILQFRATFVDIETRDPSSSTIYGIFDVPESCDALVPGATPQEQLHAILKICQEIGHSLAVKEILELALRTLFELFPQLDRGFALLRDDASGALVPQAILSRRKERESVTVSQTILNLVVNQGKAVLSEDTTTDPRFLLSASIRNSEIHTLMCVPLFVQERNASGFLQIDKPRDQARFTQKDLNLVLAVASQVSMALERSRLHDVLARQREAEKELRCAREVQRALLPRRRPRLGNLEFWDYYEPARVVGGDYYDYVPIVQAGRSPAAPGRFSVTLGDVSGKGMPAALVMARLSAGVRLLLLSEPDPARVVEQLNQELCDAEIGEMFITFLLVLIDEDRQMTVVNAGHMGPLIRRSSGSIEVISEDRSGPPLALVEGQTYEATVTSIAQDDVVVLYTDGVHEALNAEGECFSTARLKQTIALAPPRVVPTGESILREVRQHLAGCPQSDDLTLLCFG